MEQGDSQSTLRDNLLALPFWAALVAVGLPAIGVGVGFTLLLVPELSDALRTAGGQILVVALPVLAIAAGLLGASWARTERIDSMVAAFVRDTVGDKLEAYLVGPRPGDDLDLFPAPFVRMGRHYRKDITSYCRFQLIDDRERRFDIVVKSNVFNFEIDFVLHLATTPATLTPEMSECSYDLDSLEDWPLASTNPLVELVAATLHGSLAEGYTIFVKAEAEDGGGLCVRYRMRQKVQANFLTSPYLRRYFSEDAAIASYFFYTEAFANSGAHISSGVG